MLKYEFVCNILGATLCNLWPIYQENLKNSFRAGLGLLFFKLYLRSCCKNPRSTFGLNGACCEINDGKVYEGLEGHLTLFTDLSSDWNSSVNVW